MEIDAILYDCSMAQPEMKNLYKASIIFYIIYCISVFISTPFSVDGVLSHWDLTISAANVAVYTLAFMSLSIRTFTSHRLYASHEVSLQRMDLMMLVIQLLGDIMMISGLSPMLVYTSGRRVYIYRLASTVVLGAMSIYVMEVERERTFSLPV